MITEARRPPTLRLRRLVFVALAVATLSLVTAGPASAYAPVTLSTPNECRPALTG